MTAAGLLALTMKTIAHETVPLSQLLLATNTVGGGLDPEHDHDHKARRGLKADDEAAVNPNCVSRGHCTTVGPGTKYPEQ